MEDYDIVRFILLLFFLPLRNIFTNYQCKEAQGTQYSLRKAELRIPKTKDKNYIKFRHRRTIDITFHNDSIKDEITFYPGCIARCYVLMRTQLHLLGTSSTNDNIPWIQILAINRQGKKLKSRCPVGQYISVFSCPH